MKLERRASPNQNHRPLGTVIDTLVLHADASKKMAGTISWILNKASRVSYHYAIGRAGHVYEFVQPTRRAWHAGKSVFHGKPNCNDYSIGVCFSNDQAGEPFPDLQVEAGAKLVASLMGLYPIPLERITTHAAIAVPPGRKTDPGPLFPLTFFLSRVQHYLEDDAPRPAA